MIRVFIYMLAVALLTGCAADVVEGDHNHDQMPLRPKPTVPIKRRPIVPTTKLPRPRIIETIEWLESIGMRVTLCEAHVNAEVVVRDSATGTWTSYALNGTTIDIPLPDTTAEVTIYIGDEEYTVRVE